jgi:hypothetical protein
VSPFQDATVERIWPIWWAIVFSIVAHVPERPCSDSDDRIPWAATLIGRMDAPGSVALDPGNQRQTFIVFRSILAFTPSG